MSVRSVRALNTTTGMKGYSIAVIGECSELGAMREALGNCGMESEVAFLHNEESKDGEDPSITDKVNFEPHWLMLGGKSTENLHSSVSCRWIWFTDHVQYS